MSAKSLFARLGGIFRSRRPRPRVPVTLYTRPGCHLCEELERLVRAQRLGVELDWTRVDVDSSPDLAQRYGERIPVLTIGGAPGLRGGPEARDGGPPADRALASFPRLRRPRGALDWNCRCL